MQNYHRKLAYFLQGLQYIDFCRWSISSIQCSYTCTWYFDGV